MSRWRIAVVVALVALPVAFWAGLGSYYLWQTGWGLWTWWLTAGVTAVGYGLAAYWQSKRQLLTPPDFAVEPHWTARDKEAWKIVERRAAESGKIPPEKLATVPFYLETAKELANELAGFYHPGVKEPLDGVTVPEILAVAELATHDMGEMVEKHLPGGHLLTVRDWRRAGEFAKWAQRGNDVYWAVSAVFNPLNTVIRYAASQLGMAAPLKLLQQNLYGWFYVAFVHRLGTYLIDMNSGRLRVGATRYRELVAKMDAQAAAEASPLEKHSAAARADGADAVDDVRRLSLTLVGQTKAGKSSLVNAVLGEQRAKVGAVPTTDGISRYELETPGIPTRLLIADTVGYAQAGPKADQVAATAEQAKGSDLLVLAVHAKNPAQQADVEMLDGLRAWFAARPDLIAPPIICVVTHIDLLSPVMEWSPPYDWQRGSRPKEVNIREAVAAVRARLGDRVAAVVPACTAEGKVFGVEEFVIPAVANLLDELHAVAMLRALKADADKDRVRRVFEQVAATGKVLVDAAWKAVRGKP